VARFHAAPRGMLFGSLGNPRSVEARLSDAEREAIEERLRPVLDRLNEQRRAFFDATEQQLRLRMGGAAVAGLVLGWLLMGNVLIGLALMVGGAFFAFLMLAPKVDETARAQTKHAIVAEMAEELLGLTSIAPDARVANFPHDDVDGWCLLPPVREITVDDLLVGERGGFDVAVSRVGFQFGGSSNVVLKRGDGVVFLAVKVSAPNTGEVSNGDVTVIVGTGAPAMLRSAPAISHGFSPIKNGDEDFDVRYVVYGDPAPLTQEVWASLAALESVSRCDKTGTREVPAGTGLRPVVIIRPGRLVVLTPVPVFDGMLEPPPFWETLEAQNVVPAFRPTFPFSTIICPQRCCCRRRVLRYSTNRGI